MQNTQETRDFDNLRLKLALLANLDLWCSVLDEIHLAPSKLMDDIPLYLLEMLLYLARERKMDKAAEALEREIELNLEAQRRADEAKREAREAEQWLEEVKDLQKSIEARLAAEGVELDKLDEIDE